MAKKCGQFPPAMLAVLAILISTVLLEYTMLWLSDTQSQPAITLIDRRNRQRCFQGRVFGVGVFKTGTTTLAAALASLGKKCAKRSCIFIPPWMFPEFNRRPHKWDAYFLASEQPSLLMDVPSVNETVQSALQSATAFADAPWLFLWPFFDAWHPGSKFILTVRDSTAAVVNSDFKMNLRHRKLNALPALSEVEPTLRVTYAEYAMLIARRYEVQNARVLRHFRERTGDLLILNIQRDMTVHSELAAQWRPLMRFLHCPLSAQPSKPIPNKNSAPKSQATSVLPPNFTLDWRSFHFSERFSLSGYDDPWLAAFIEGSDQDMVAQYTLDYNQR